MAGALHILVACSNRKRKRPAAFPRMRTYAQVDMGARFEAWQSSLDDPELDRTEAEELYGGESWQQARRLVQTARDRGFDPKAWVISAGFGLLPFEARICHYDATFSPGQPDSVGRDANDASRWWQLLARWQPSGLPPQPRSIRNLVDAHPDDNLLLVVSPPYLNAISPDIRSAIHSLGANTDLMICCSGIRNPPPHLAPNLLPAEGKLQGVLGGSLGSLSARAASYALAHLDPKDPMLGNARLALARLLEDQPMIERPKRKQMSDEDVRTFIRAALAEEAKLKRTVLLRRLRDSGCACEQSRFKALYEQVRGA